MQGRPGRPRREQNVVGDLGCKGRIADEVGPDYVTDRPDLVMRHDVAGVRFRRENRSDFLHDGLDFGKVGCPTELDMGTRAKPFVEGKCAHIEFGVPKDAAEEIAK